MTAYTFSQLIDFTRTTSATYVNASGLITTTPASVNLLLYTQDFDNAYWSKVNATVTANAVAAPDGTLTADAIIEDTVNSSHGVGSGNATVALGSVTWSVYAKAGTRSWMWINAFAGANNRTWFNLASGTVGTTGAGATASITSVGNGWYRCSVALTSGTTTVSMGANAASADGATSYAGTASATAVYLWGAQLEVGSAPSTYTKNVGGFFPPRFDYNPTTLAPRGFLVEEQRTNLFVRSQEFDNAVWSKVASTVTANATTAPDGAATADLVIPSTAASTAHLLFRDAVNTFAVNAPATISFYAKAAGYNFAAASITFNGNSGGAGVVFDLVNLTSATLSASGDTTITSSVVDAGNGWRRCVLTVSSSALTLNSASISMSPTSSPAVSAAYRTPSFTGDGTSGMYFYGAQLEAGSFPTSYIPTVASTVTRTADQAAIVAPMFAPWFSQPEGTFVAEFDCVLPATTGGLNKTVFAASDNSTSNRVFQYIPDSGAPTVRISSGGATQATIATTAISSNTVAKSATAYKVNDFVLVSNGGTPATDTSGSVPIGVDRMEIGSFLTANFLNGHLRSINYYPLRLTNAQLQGLTT
jgi:hypothetical protein